MPIISLSDCWHGFFDLFYNKILFKIVCFICIEIDRQIYQQTDRQVIKDEQCGSDSGITKLHDAAAEGQSNMN